MSLTDDWSDTALRKWWLLAMRLDADPFDLAGVAMSESGLHSWSHNPGGADGLIQFTNLRSLGWTGTSDAFRQLTPEQQLPFVERYWRPYAGKLSAGWLAYVATFLPALLDEARATGPDIVLCARGGRLGWAYEANAVFDTDHNLQIEGRELAAAIDRNARGPRWDEWVMRLREIMGLEPVGPSTQPPANLGTTKGIQEALAWRGFDPGPIDGIPGARTRAALIAFQKSAGLTPDGIPGPLTRAALSA